MLVLVAVRVCLVALLLELGGARLLGQNAGWSAVLGTKGAGNKIIP